MAFKPGQSGNPKGRPRGLADARLQYHALFHAEAEAIIGKALEMAKAGDPQALKLCMDRIAPAYKTVDRPVSLNLPDDDLSEQAKAILRQLASGNLTPDECSAILGAIASQARIYETSELERRIKALEDNVSKS